MDDTAVADTVTVVASLAPALKRAVTVETPPSSPTDAGDSTSVTVGASSSVMVPVPTGVLIGVSAGSGLPMVTATVSSGSSVVSPVTDTVNVLLVSPAAKVSVPAVSAV